MNIAKELVKKLFFICCPLQKTFNENISIKFTICIRRCALNVMRLQNSKLTIPINKNHTHHPKKTLQKLQK